MIPFFNDYVKRISHTYPRSGSQLYAFCFVLCALNLYSLLYYLYSLLSTLYSIEHSLRECVCQKPPPSPQAFQHLSTYQASFPHRKRSGS
jgi:hypothetical protein